MQNYYLSPEMSELFQSNSWWVFVGRYFGFPDCCVKEFCETEEREESLFTGTGYVPCPCCNLKITSATIVKEWKKTINQRRFHNKKFGQDDCVTDNPQFF